MKFLWRRQRGRGRIPAPRVIARVKCDMEELFHKLYDEYGLLNAVGVNPVVSAATSNFGAVQAARAAAICCEGCRGELRSLLVLQRAGPQEESILLEVR